MRIAIASLFLLLFAAPPAADAEVEPFSSFSSLTTGNGFGFQVFDEDRNAITTFLERPYLYLRPDPANPDGEGLRRRDLAFDTYFGLRAGGESAWLAERAPSEVSYVEETNVIRSVVEVGPLTTESFFFSPYGYAGNGMVMLLRVRNGGATQVPAEAFSVHNFKLGPAPNPDDPGASGEAISYDPAAGAATETGPGGGAMIYLPLESADVSSCAPGAWQEVKDGDALAAAHDCSGTDRVNVFARDLGAIPPGESRSFAVAVLFDAGGDGETVSAAFEAFTAGRGGEALLADTLAEWEAWRGSDPGLSGEELRVWRQSEAVLRMGQVLEPYSETPKRKGHGMVLASLPPGNWHAAWVRDAAYAIVALARTGHHEEAKKGLQFFLDAEAGHYSSYLGGVDYRISTVRYFGNGVEEADYSGHPTRNIEIDGWGLFLWAARAYIDASGDVGWLEETTRDGEVVYDVLRAEVAEALAANLEPEGMPVADASIWEVHWGNREHFTYTAATTARGFCDMASLARRLDRREDRDRYKRLAERASAALKDHFTDGNRVLAGSMEALARGTDYHDGSVVEAFTWDVIPPSDPIAAATMGHMVFLRTPVGGYKRLDGTGDQYNEDEWIFVDLRASQVFRELGNLERADSLVKFVTAQARLNQDLIPELYNTSEEAGPLGGYTGSIPMVGYGAGLYMIALLERGGESEQTDCGTAGPPFGDGGPGFSDGGNPAAGDAGISPPSGAGCLCRAAGAPGPGQALLMLLCAGFLLRRRRPPEG